MRHLDLAPMIEAELERLVEQMKKNYQETSQEADAISEELKLWMPGKWRLRR